MRKKGGGSEGFTLIELLIVIAIIGILAVVLLVQLGGSRGKARDAKRISDIGQIQTAVELYYNDNNKYPADLNAVVSGGYMSSRPTDPEGVSYNYIVSGNTKYQIWVELEGANTALNSDNDLNKAWSKNGTLEACTDAADDCIYDVGQK